MNVEEEVRRARRVVLALLRAEAPELGLGVVDLVDIFAEDRFRFRVARAGPYEVGVEIPVRTVDTVLEDGQWVIAEWSDAEPIGSITLTA